MKNKRRTNNIRKKQKGRISNKRILLESDRLPVIRKFRHPWRDFRAIPGLNLSLRPASDCPPLVSKGLSIISSMLQSIVRLDCVQKREGSQAKRLELP